jgi:hypothetical protein
MCANPHSVSLPSQSTFLFGRFLEERCDDTVYLSVTLHHSSQPGQAVEKCDKCDARDLEAMDVKDQTEASKMPGSYDISALTNVESYTNKRLTEASGMITFDGTEPRRQFKDGSIGLSLLVGCHCTHRNGSNDYKRV